MKIDRSNLLPTSFYENPDVVEVSKNLLGKVICSTVNSKFTAGIITETEAYSGRDDKACHANNGLRTERTNVMYGEPGHAYIYLCYGIHHLLNVVTNKKGLADAVLIRALKPLNGIEIMKERRGTKQYANLSDGPGKLTKALGVTKELNKANLSDSPLWIEDREVTFKENEIHTSQRIGIDYAEEDALKPWRFYVE